METRVLLDALLPKLSANLETTVRRVSPTSVNSMGVHQQRPASVFFLRPSLIYAFEPWLSTALGYAYNPTFLDGQPRSADTHEHRVWEQLDLRHAWGPMELSGRTRFEQRMRTQGSGSGDVELRLRQRGGIAYALPPQPAFSLIVNDELFFQLNRTSFPSTPGFSQNRAFVGLGYRAGDATIQVGYMNQWSPARGSSPARDNHVLRVNLRFTFDTAPKKPATKATQPSQPPSSPASSSHSPGHKTSPPTYATSSPGTRK